MEYLLIILFICMLYLGEALGLYIFCENCEYLHDVKQVSFLVPIIKLKMFWKCLKLSFCRKNLKPILIFFKTDNKDLRILLKLANVREMAKNNSKEI